MPQIPEVTPIEGERWCFNVHSRSRPGQMHRVDLESFGWSGACACERFAFGCAPKLTRGAGPSDSLRCGHIRAARSYVMEKIFPLMAARMDHCPTPLDRGREAVASLESLNDLVTVRQMIDARIEEITK